MPVMGLLASSGMHSRFWMPFDALVLVLRVSCSNELSWLVRQKAKKFVAVRQTDFV